MTRKIHPLDSVRLTLNCEAGTLSLDVNGVDQGIVFSNVPAEVHPAVCFYGSAKSVRLVELKRIYSESDGDTSDSEDESDEEDTTCHGDEEKEAAPLSQRPSQQQQPEEQPQTRAAAEVDSSNSNHVGASVSPAVEPRGNARARDGADKLARGSRGNLSHRRSARREEEAVSSFIRAASASSPSRGLLASLANLAQWYVPRGEEDIEREEHGATEQRSDAEEGEGDRMNRLSEPVDDSAHAVSRLMAGKCVLSNCLCLRVRRTWYVFWTAGYWPAHCVQAMTAFTVILVALQFGFVCVATPYKTTRSLPTVWRATAIFVSFSFQPRRLQPTAAGALPGLGRRLMSRPAGFSGAKHR